MFSAARSLAPNGSPQVATATLLTGELRLLSKKHSQNVFSFASPAELYPQKNGGAEGNRTPDLLNAIQTLSQLSYNPIITFKNHRAFIQTLLASLLLASVTRFLNSLRSLPLSLLIKKTSPLVVKTAF